MKKCLSVMCALSAGVGLPARGLMGGPVLRDVRFLSADVIDSKDEADFRDRSLPPQKLIKVSFAGNVDFTALFRQAADFIGNAASICDAGNIDESKRLRGFAGIYNSLGDVESYERDDKNAELSRREIYGHEPIVYHFYLSIKRTESSEASSGASPGFSYDLKSHPEDVCFQVGGGTMLGSRFVSNTAVVPKGAIAEALSEIGPQ